MAASPSCSFLLDKPGKHCLSRDDYIDLRNSQDEQLNAELTSIRRSIDTQNHRLGRLEDQTKRLEAEIRQTQAYMRNSALKNPTFRIRPLVIYRPGDGILEPNSAHFPRNVNEFYALRNPKSNRHRLMLTYLANFYDVRLQSAGSSSEVDSSCDDEDEIILDHPDLVVEKLEDILGLNEDKINKFKERAALLASRTPSQPIKRSQITFPEGGAFHGPRRPRLESRFADAPDQVSQFRDPFGPETTKSVSSEGLTTARLEWRTRSTPSSQRERIRLSPEEVATMSKLLEPERKSRKSAPSDSEPDTTDVDDQTRAFTESPERRC